MSKTSIYILFKLLTSTKSLLDTSQEKDGKIEMKHITHIVNITLTLYIT